MSTTLQAAIQTSKIRFVEKKHVKSRNVAEGGFVRKNPKFKNGCKCDAKGRQFPKSGFAACIKAKAANPFPDKARNKTRHASTPSYRHAPRHARAHPSRRARIRRFGRHCRPHYNHDGRGRCVLHDARCPAHTAPKLSFSQLTCVNGGQVPSPLRLAVATPSPPRPQVPTPGPKQPPVPTPAR